MLWKIQIVRPCFLRRKCQGCWLPRAVNSFWVHLHSASAWKNSFRVIWHFKRIACKAGMPIFTALHSLRERSRWNFFVLRHWERRSPLMRRSTLQLRYSKYGHHAKGAWFFSAPQALTAYLCGCPTICNKCLNFTLHFDMRCWLINFVWIIPTCKWAAVPGTSHKQLLIKQ